MFVVLLLLFTVVPVVELALLIQIGQALGALPTIGLVLLTGAVGAALAKHQGLSVLARIQAELRSGRMPAESLGDAALVLVAGVLLVTPGVLTDVVGFSLLVPPCRAVARRLLARWARGRFQVADLSQGPLGQGPLGQGPLRQGPLGAGPFPGPAGETRDVEARVRDVEATVRDPALREGEVEGAEAEPKALEARPDRTGERA